mgnify:CR=1 FL=1
MPRALRGLFIGIGAVVVSTIAIQASDLVKGIDGGLVGLVRESSTVCGAGAIPLQLGTGTLCVDIYEAAAGAGCPHRAVSNPLHTNENLLETSCQPVSEPDRLPWRFVSLSEAEQLCARSGKRLPVNEEWHRLVVQQTEQSHCTTNTDGPTLTGAAGCVSNAGLHDLVGNLWEWIDGSITHGVYQGRTLPDSGYVRVTDNNGVVVETSDTPDTAHGADYAWTSESGVFGMLRGGYFASDSDGGLYAQNLAAPFDLRTSGVGFRCVRSL